MLELGPFTLEAPIGRGGMGTVWGGVHRRSGAPVAIKILEPHPSATPADGASRLDPFAEGFAQEVRAVASLDHPAIVLVLDHGVIPRDVARALELAPGSPWLAMERAEGTLSPWCGNVDWVEIRAVLLAVLDALAHAHARGVVHLDLKPANVLVGASRSRVALTDFGLAHVADRAPTDGPAHASAGTPGYMAPEQWHASWRDFGPWTDLYGLGCVAWALATGQPPFGRLPLAAAMTAHLVRDLPTFEPAAPVPDGFVDWLHGMLAKGPRARFQRAADAAWALRRLPVGVRGIRARSSDLADADQGSTVLVAPIAPGALSSGGVSLAEAPPVPTDWRPRDSSDPSAGARVFAESASQAALARAASSPRPPRLVDAGLGLFGLRARPVVGREREQDALWARLVAVSSSGAPAGIVLSGPAGCGKSALASWIGERAHELGAASRLRALHAANPGPAHGVEAMFERALSTMGATPAEVRERLELHAPTLHDRDRELCTRQLRPGGVPLGGRLRRRARIRLIEALCASSPRRPMVLWLDDVQWGADTLELATELMAVPAPILVVVTARAEAIAERPEEAARLEAFAAHRSVTSLEIGPLSASSQRALIASLLSLGPDLASAIEARTGGNPLFAVQLVGDWVERGLLVSTPIGFALADGAEPELPADLEEVWAARVGRLLEGRRPSDRLALELAAALGEVVDRVEWHAVCAFRGVRPSSGLLEAMLEARLARVEADGWAFVHGMLRESLGASARRADRWADHHAACAEVVAQGEGRGVSARHGRHLVGAGAWAEALAPLARGAHEAYLAGNLAEVAVLLAERGAACDALALPSDDRERAVGLELESTRQTAQGAFATSRELALRAAAIARTVGDDPLLARSLRQAGDASLALSEWAEALRLFSDAHAAALRTDDSKLQAWTLSAVGWAHLNQGALEPAAAALNEALACFVARDEVLGLASCHHGLAFVAIEGAQDLDEAERHLLAAVDASRQGGQASREGDALSSLGSIARQRGQLDAAHAYFARAEAILADLGHVLVWIPRANLALLELDRERWEIAIPALEDLIGQLASTEMGLVAAGCHAALIRCLAEVGRWEELDAACARARPVFADPRNASPEYAASLATAAARCEARGEPGRASAIRALGPARA